MPLANTATVDARPCSTKPSVGKPTCLIAQHIDQRDHGCTPWQFEVKEQVSALSTHVHGKAAPPSHLGMQRLSSAIHSWTRIALDRRRGSLPGPLGSVGCSGWSYCWKQSNGAGSTVAQSRRGSVLRMGVPEKRGTHREKRSRTTCQFGVQGSEPKAQVVWVAVEPRSRQDGVLLLEA